ncbi:MAG: ATP synthase F1 subunit epsilon [Planctomycetota bacterium]|jgi:F-type H+-transporting ATPase subunit epsilon
MADKSFQCSVITPEKQVYDDIVDSVSIPAHDGEIGILFNRAPLVCKLGIGALRIRKGDDEQRWFVDGGFAQVLENRLVLLTDQALHVDQLDRAEAERILEESRGLKDPEEIMAVEKAHAEAVARVQLRMTGKR